MRRIAAPALAVLAVAMVACGSTSSAASHRVGQVTLTVSGGFAGWSREVVVDAGGTARLTVTHGPTPTRGPHAVPSPALDQLRALLADPAFGALAAEYPAPSGSADVQAYAVTAEVDGHHLASTTYDAAAAPQVLRDVISLLVDVLDSFYAAAGTCAAGYSPTSPVVHLGDSDGGTTRTVPLCASIWVVLQAPANGAQWQSVQSSDTSVLEIVPLPLPHPPGGGTEAVYLARGAGSARLFAASTMPACPSGAMCPVLAGWSVSITVAAG